MRLVTFELKKLLSLPMLWVFMLLCLILNGTIIISNVYDTGDIDFSKYMSKTLTTTGTQMGEEFDKILTSMPESEWRNLLISQTSDAESTFISTDATALGDKIISLYGFSGFWEKQITNKYEKLQIPVGQLVERNASLSVYFAGMTRDFHQLLFSSLFSAMTTEVCLLAVLSMLYLLGYEAQNHTQGALYTTRRGRSIQKNKIFAGIILAILMFVILFGASLLLFFSIFDCSGIWNSNVSSQFNYIQELGFTKPFWTWISFTVAEYLMARLMLAAMLVIVFSLFAAFIGLQCKNSYMGFVAFLTIAFGMMALPQFCASMRFWGGYFLSEFLPIPLWYCSSQWLTDLGGISLIPWHETIALIGNTIFFFLLILFALRKFNRKDII